MAYSRIWEENEYESRRRMNSRKEHIWKLVLIAAFRLGKVVGTCGRIVRAYVWAFCLARVTQRAESSRIDRPWAGWLVGWLVGWLAGWLAGHATLVEQVIFVRPKKTVQDTDFISRFVIRYFTACPEFQGYVTPNVMFIVGCLTTVYQLTHVHLQIVLVSEVDMR